MSSVTSSGPAPAARVFPRDYTKPEIDLTWDNKDSTKLIGAVITTEDLYMERTSQGHCKGYESLFGDVDNIGSYYLDGEAWSKERTQKRVGIWDRRTQDGDPFCAFAVSLKNSDEVGGHIVLGYSDTRNYTSKEGYAELAGIARNKFWRDNRSTYIGENATHWATQAASAVVNYYAPAVHDQGCRLGNNLFAGIVATTHPENEASWKVLQAIGFTYQEAFIRETTDWKELSRHLYRANIKEVDWRDKEMYQSKR